MKVVWHSGDYTEHVWHGRASRKICPGQGRGLPVIFETVAKKLVLLRFGEQPCCQRDCVSSLCTPTLVSTLPDERVISPRGTFGCNGAPLHDEHVSAVP